MKPMIIPTGIELISSLRKPALVEKAREDAQSMHNAAKAVV
jgi:hypothetical protein